MQSVDTTMTVSCSALVSYHIPLFLSVSALVSYHTPPFLSVYCTLLPIIKVYIFPFHISSTHILKPKPRSCLVITNLVFCSAGCPVSPSSLVYHGRASGVAGLVADIPICGRMVPGYIVPVADIAA